MRSIDFPSEPFTSKLTQTPDTAATQLFENYQRPVTQDSNEIAQGSAGAKIFDSILIISVVAE